MSTRANIIIKDENDTLYFYRHSDGYPEGAGEDLKEFVQDFGSAEAPYAGPLRRNVQQSAGWLVVRGHFEYKSAEPSEYPNPRPSRVGPRPDASDRFDGWKVGAYEPTTGLHFDVEYIYIIDLSEGTLECRVPDAKNWDATLKNTKASKKFKTVRF